jgi:cell division protein FtsB
MTVLFFIVVLAFLARWIHSWAVEGPALQPHYEAEIARLRGEVDELNAQVARLTDEQQFMMRLLTAGEARPGPELPPAPTHEETS